MAGYRDHREHTDLDQAITADEPGRGQRASSWSARSIILRLAAAARATAAAAPVTHTAASRQPHQAHGSREWATDDQRQTGLM